MYFLSDYLLASCPLTFILCSQGVIMEISIGAVFVAGVLSFFTPCVLPLLPAYSALLFDGTETSKSKGLINSGAFLLGFCLVFVAMGAAVGALADFFWDYQDIIRKAGAVFMILMGAYMLGVLKTDTLSQEYRPLLNRTFKGPIGAFVFGVAFTVGWTPCVSPILTSVLAYAASGNTAQRGSLLLLIYALGFCLPFLSMAALARKYMQRVRTIYQYLPIVQKIFGVIIIILGIALYMDWIKLLTSL